MRRRRNVITGFLDHGTMVTGELRFSGTMRIEGEFHGSIATEDILTVGRGAAVHADIRAGEVEVHGRVSGNIEATRRIVVHSSGKIRGDVTAPILVVEDGATLDGQSCMTGGVEPSGARASSASRFEGVDEAH
jgi:cytoskeletal protein CcmA (bactofilin family)